MLVSAKQTAAALAMWAIRQSPYAAPDNLTSVVERFQALFPKADDQFGFVDFADERALRLAVQEVSEQIPELLAWNERKNGNQSPLAFSSRYDQPSPNDDFIDLDALWRNVARTVADEERTHANV